MREIRRRFLNFRLACGCLLALLAGTALAADPNTFLNGTSKDCTACDLSGRDLKERNFERSRLDQALFRNADLTGASLFRSTLHRSDVSRPKLVGDYLHDIVD